VLEEQVLDPELHDRARFTCGQADLDEFLKRFAMQQMRKDLTVVWVLVDSERPSEILGFYSLSAAQIEISSLQESERKALPRYPLPCFRMGRLACSSEHQGRGIGRVLIGLAVSRCVEAKMHVAAFALIVDAKDENAKTFYSRYGFAQMIDSPMSLYLPLAALPKRKVV
jgi:GNAT superfamily N-acetyltransferase